MTRPDQFSPGAAVFAKVIGRANTSEQPVLRRLVSWAEELEREGLANLRSMTGDAHRWELQLRAPRKDIALVKAWHESGKASLQLHASQFNLGAPRAKRLLQSLGIRFEDRAWIGVLDWTERELAVLKAAFVEAGASDPSDAAGLLDALERRLPSMGAEREAPQGTVRIGRVIVVRDDEDEIVTYRLTALPSAGEVALSPDAPLGAALLNRRVGETVEYLTPGGRQRATILEVRG